MASVERLGSHPYQVRYTAVPVCEVSNQEKKVPDDYINEAGNDVTEKMMEYLKPLIHGETEIIYENGNSETFVPLLSFSEGFCQKVIEKKQKIVEL